MVRVFANGPGNGSSIPGRVIPKTEKQYLMPPSLTLSIIRKRSRVSGAIQGKKWCPPLHLGVVAVEKEAFGSPSISVGQLIYIYIYIYGSK